MGGPDYASCLQDVDQIRIITCLCFGSYGTVRPSYKSYLLKISVTTKSKHK